MMNHNEISAGILQSSVPLTLFEITDSPFDRIHLSKGVYSPTTMHQYANTAYLPKEPWRQMMNHEMPLLIKKQKNYSSSATLLRVPKEIIDPFMHLGLPLINTRNAFYSALSTPEGQWAISNAEKYVDSYLVKGEGFKIIPVFNEPGLTTTAFVPERNHFIGLHVDYLFQQTIFQRQNSANRISINLGNQDRYLIYINFTLDDLIELLQPSPSCTTDELVLHFFQRFPNYPVIRVTIKPGEAYIAPTQNLIHDGISSKETADMHLTICGHIQFF